MNSILSNLRRSRDRTRTKSSSSSPSKAKPLHILPELVELSELELEEDPFARSPVIHLSPSYTPRNLSSASTSPADASSKKRDSRRVVLTGAEGLTFEDFFPLHAPRPAPSPPTARSQKASRMEAESPLESIDLRFSGFGLPFAQTPASPRSSRSARSPSPTPSVASSASVSSMASTSSARAKVLTPPTSDDESHEPIEPIACRLARAPTHKSHRGTIGYVPGARKQRSASEKSFVDLDLRKGEHADEDASWFAQDISDSFVLSSQVETEAAAVPKTPVASTSKAAGRSRFSKPLPIVPRLSIQSVGSPCPSAQLDPDFPVKRKSYIPNRPPPPPPIRIIDVDSDLDLFVAPSSPEPSSARASPTMEEKTEELLALLANAALSSGITLALPAGPSRLSCGSSLAPMSATPSSYNFVVSTPTMSQSGTPITPRPLPRSSVPADIFNSIIDDSQDLSVSSLPEEGDLLDEVEFGDLEWLPESDDESLPTTPQSARSQSIYSQSSMPRFFSSELDLDLDSIPLEPCTPALTAFFESPCDDYAGDVAMPDSPLIRPFDDLPQEKVLRSRWSSSTLAESLAERRGSGWMGRLAFGSTSGKKSPTKPSFSLKSPTLPSFNIAKPTFASPTKKASTPVTTPTASPAKKPFVLAAAPSPTKAPRLSGSPRTLSRRESNASLCTSDSGESTFSASSSSSNGLRRKPIPVEIFMRS